MVELNTMDAVRLSLDALFSSSRGGGVTPSFAWRIVSNAQLLGNGMSNKNLASDIFRISPPIQKCDYLLARLNYYAENPRTNS
jgi:hypothetical protein